MSNVTDLPCRVSADLRAKQLREDQFVPVEFDDTNEDHWKAILGNSHAELLKPLMGLLNSFHAIDRAERGFGPEALDHAKAVKWLMPDLNRLREACARIFAEER